MSVLNAIGNTPLVELGHVWNTEKSKVRICAKLEGNNPGGSIKDRPAYYMLKKAEELGVLKGEKIILEPTSGNTGIGMSMIAAAMGYRIKLTMPACVSEERRAILAALGAELELTPGCDKTDGAINRAHHIMDTDGDKYFMPNQFSNDNNWLAHYETTAPEIYEQANGEVTAIVAGMGTTGTLMGISRYFKEKSPNTQIVGIEPIFNHRIQGLKNMNESIVPEIYEPNRLDSILTCCDDDAFNCCRDLAVKEGIFAGISSGAALWGAIEVAKDMPAGSTVVTIFPDRGDRYLSTEVFHSVCALCPP